MSARGVERVVGIVGTLMSGEDVTETIDEELLTGLIGLICALIEQLAEHLGITTKQALDIMLMRATALAMDEERREDR